MVLPGGVELMPTTFPAETGDRMAEQPIRPGPDVDGVCDRSECPAPATRRADLFGQDFYFCTHHWAELRAPTPQDHPDTVDA
jgi:hypothetical protein